MRTFWKDVTLEIEDRVYEPAEDSFLLVDNLKVKGRVLEIGTGSGLAAIAAARQSAEVTAIDIDPKAVKCAKKNAALNGVKIKFLVGDLFGPVSGKYDVIIFNPPYLPSAEEEKRKDPALAGGKDGETVIRRFISVAADYLNPGGRILLVVSSLNKNIFELLHTKFKVSVIDARKFFFEKLFILELK